MNVLNVVKILYLIQTEIIDRKKLRADPTIMTSARWMAEKRPHPIWLFFKRRGAKEKYAMVYLVGELLFKENFLHMINECTGTQFVYTILTLLPIIPVFQSFELHAIYLGILFTLCVWNGANFYFEIFTETYSKRLQRVVESTMQKEVDSNAAGVDKPTQAGESPDVTAKATGPSADAVKKFDDVKEADVASAAASQIPVASTL
jgi:hypothetical protein